MYERFYGLIAKPFRLTPDARFLFQSRGHGKALAYLRYGLQSGEGFVVITGEVGAGKTTLAQALLSNLNSDSVVAGQFVSTRLDPEETLRMVAASFGLQSQHITKADLLQNFRDFLAERVRAGKRVLLVVDEVQNLPVEAIEELRTFSGYQVQEKASMQIFFLGQSEFVETVQSATMEQFRQRVIAAHHLGALGADETSRYIRHRLQLAGWQDDPHITDDAFAAIHEYTGGIPRRINALCDKALLNGCLEELHRITAETVVAIAADEAGRFDTSSGSATTLPAVSRPDDDSNQPIDQPARMISDTERSMRALEKRMDALERHRGRLIELLRVFLDEEDEQSSGRVDMMRRIDGA